MKGLDVSEKESVKKLLKKQMMKPVNEINNYIVEAINANGNLVALALAGLFSLVFEPVRGAGEWHRNNAELIYSLMAGTGISGVICWLFSFRLKMGVEVTKLNFNLPCFLWLFCHFLSVCAFLYFLSVLGVRKDGSFSGLALGVFGWLILSTPFSILNSTLYLYRRR